MFVNVKPVSSNFMKTESTTNNIAGLPEDLLLELGRKVDSFANKVNVFAEFLRADINIAIYKNKIATLSASNSTEAQRTVSHFRGLLSIETEKYETLKLKIETNNYEPTVSSENKLEQKSNA